LYHINGYVRTAPAGPTAGSVLGIQVNGIMIKRETFPVSAFSAIHLSTEAYLMVGDLVNMIGYSPSGTWTSSYMAGGNALDPAAPTLEVWRIAGGPKGDKGDQGGPVIPPADVLITPTLLNGWTYFGSPYTPVSYYKDQIGIVRLRGMIQHASNRTLNMFTLPTGYVPSHTLILAATSQDQTASVRIGGVINEGGARTAGMVYCAAVGNVSLPQTAGWVSLDGISFRV